MLMKATFTPIRLATMYDKGLAHPPLLGQFNHNQLVAAKTVNGAGDTIEWRRQPGESCGSFEDRIIADLQQLTCETCAK